MKDQLEHEKIHEEMLKLFNEYFKANHALMTKQTKRASMRTRKILLRMYHLCFERRKLLLEWQFEKHDEIIAKRNQKQNNKR